MLKSTDICSQLTLTLFAQGREPKDVKTRENAHDIIEFQFRI
jgi:hypothetical protein